jgi:hypothetical protein
MNGGPSAAMLGSLTRANPQGAYGLSAVRDAPVGSIVLYVAGSDEVAFDGDGRNGLLTKHVLAHIERPASRSRR